MDALGYQIKYFRGYFLDVEYLLRIMVEVYGKKKALDYVESKISELSWVADDA